MVSYPKDWKKVKLSDLIIPYGGLSGKSSNDFISGNEKYISYLSVFNDTIVKSISEKVKIIPGEKQNIVKKGDLIFTQSSETAEEVGMASTYLGDEEVYLNSFCFGGRKKIEFDSFFMVCLLRSKRIREEISKVGQGSTRYNLSPSRLLNIEVNYPEDISEQKAISKILLSFDKQIYNLSKLIEKKKMIRDGAVEDLMTGKTRLDGFEDEWEEKTVGDILKIFHGRSQHLVESPTGKYPILGTGGIIGKSVDYLCDWECVCIGRKGTIDKPIYVDYPFWSIDTLYYSKSLNKNDAKFQYYLFTTINWIDYTESSGRPSLSKDEIESIVIKTPSDIKEQQAIADILTAMDKEIADLEKEKEKYVALKAGAMDDLLTGKIRLV